MARKRGDEGGAAEAEADGEVVTWESVKWKDGSRYEGLVKDGKCHIRGVLRYANGDRYEGEYKDNLMSGLGVYVWKNGAVYRGEWRENNMHGCGVKLIPKAGGGKRAGRGGHGGGAVDASLGLEGIVPQEGEWLEDGYVGDIMACSKYLSRKKAMDADFAAASARALALDGPHHRQQQHQQQSKKEKGGGARRGQEAEGGERRRQRKNKKNKELADGRGAGRPGGGQEHQQKENVFQAFFSRFAKKG